MAIYPGAITSRKSPIRHPDREATYGVVIHWTAGHEAGDVATLIGGNVDVQFYVTKSGKVYQFMDSDSQAWHGFSTANHYMVGIEHEGSGEAWTPAQYDASVKLSAWLSEQYNIPVRYTDPSGDNFPNSFKGFCGHKDLSVGGVRVDSNDHTDTVPDNPGWGKYIEEIQRLTLPPKVIKYYFEIPALGPNAKWGPYNSKLVRNIKRKLKEMETGEQARDYSKVGNK